MHTLWFCCKSRIEGTLLNPHVIETASFKLYLHVKTCQKQTVRVSSLEKRNAVHAFRCSVTAVP